MRARLFLGALVAGVAAILLVDAAEAAVAPKPEVMKFRAGKVRFRRNKTGTQGAPEADLIIVTQGGDFSLRATYSARNKKGITTRRSITLRLAGAPDLREEVTFPAVFTAESGLAGDYTVQSTTDEDPVGATKTWTIDSRGAVPFTLRWKKFDPVTSRLVGSFSGAMTSGVVGMPGVRILGGTFAVDVRIQDIVLPPPPPPGKR
jgi:hypothetical protein